MKAIVCTKYGPPEVLQLREVEKPVPKDNQVLIKIAAATATPSDCAARAGFPLIARLFNGLTKPKNPVLGVEFAGEVEAVGKNVRRFKEGDQVFGSTGMGYGAYAEHICVPEDGVLVSKPSRLTFGEAAGLCDGGLTALSFLRDQAKVAKGQRVLINGASGAVGTYAIQLAKYFGAEVTGVCSTANVELVQSLGADIVIDYTKEDFTKTGRTYDVIFDAIGKSSFLRCKRSLNEKGIYLTTVPTLAIIFQMLWSSKRSGRKAIFSATGLKKASERISGLHDLAELATSGRIKSVVDRSYPLEQIADAHRYVETGRKKGNVIISELTIKGANENEQR